jgi:ABC-type Na+ efflux pump permease subunit
MFFPIFFAVLSASSFSKTTAIPGFPKVESFMQFTLASTIVQGVLFGSVTGAAALATDIEIGFFDRLLLAPTTRTGILLGRLAGSALFGFFQSAFFLAVLVPFDAPITAGIPGALVMVLSGAMCGVGGCFFAQYFLYIDPTIVFGVDKSVEMLLVSMIGGAGTVAGCSTLSPG